MAIVGADVEQLHALARQFREKADQLESNVARSLSQNVASSPWKGTDAETFRQNWQTDLSPKIQQVVASLRDAADSVDRNADEQDRTSSVTSGTSGTPSNSTSTSPVSQESHSPQREGKRPQLPHRTEHRLPRVLGRPPRASRISANVASVRRPTTTARMASNASISPTSTRPTSSASRPTLHLAAVMQKTSSEIQASSTSRRSAPVVAPRSATSCV